jgi:hypothetical protein
MPPQSNSSSLNLHILPQNFYLIQQKASDPLPSLISDKIILPLNDSEFLSITRTKEEVSIVSDFPVEDDAEHSTAWRCIRVAGPMNLGS